MIAALKNLRFTLASTPAALRALLEGLPEELAGVNEGGDTWSPFDVIGHLIHGEKTDWIPRAKIILSDRSDKNFVPFDMTAQFDASKGKSLSDLLEEFASLRRENLTELEALGIAEEDLSRTGIHPELGEVTLAELLSTWVAHDLDHIVQVSRTLAKQYSDDVGPWKQFIRVLKED